MKKNLDLIRFLLFVISCSSFKGPHFVYINKNESSKCMYAHDFQTVSPNCMEFGMEIVLAGRTVCSTVSESHCLKANRSKYGTSIKLTISAEPPKTLKWSSLSSVTQCTHKNDNKIDLVCSTRKNSCTVNSPSNLIQTLLPPSSYHSSHNPREDKNLIIDACIDCRHLAIEVYFNFLLAIEVKMITKKLL